MPLRNINSDWMSNASSGLCILGYIILFIYAGQCAHKLKSIEQGGGLGTRLPSLPVVVSR